MRIWSMFSVPCFLSLHLTTSTVGGSHGNRRFCEHLSVARFRCGWFGWESRESSGIITDGNMAPEIVSVKGSNPQFKRLVMLVITATTRKGSCGHSRSSKYAQEPLKTFSVWETRFCYIEGQEGAHVWNKRGRGLVKNGIAGYIVIGVFDIARCHIIWPGHMTQKTLKTLRDLAPSLRTLWELEPHVIVVTWCWTKSKKLHWQFFSGNTTARTFHRESHKSIDWKKMRNHPKDIHWIQQYTVYVLFKR